MVLLQLSYAQQDSLRQKNYSAEDTVFVMHKSPWGAVLRSAIIPGWGQFYNHSYFKVPIVWGITGWLIYEWSQSNNLYKQYKNLALNPDNADYKSYYNQYKTNYQDQRDLFAIYIGLAYILNMVDAYVDAQLFDFSVSQNSGTNTPMLNMRINF